METGTTGIWRRVCGSTQSIVRKILTLTLATSLSVYPVDAYTDIPLTSSTTTANSSIPSEAPIGDAMTVEYYPSINSLQRHCCSNHSPSHLRGGAISRGFQMRRTAEARTGDAAIPRSPTSILPARTRSLSHSVNLTKKTSDFKTSLRRLIRTR